MDGLRRRVATLKARRRGYGALPAVGASSRTSAAPPLRSGPAGDPPPAGRERLVVAGSKLPAGEPTGRARERVEAVVAVRFGPRARVGELHRRGGCGTQGLPGLIGVVLKQPMRRRAHASDHGTTPAAGCHADARWGFVLREVGAVAGGGTAVVATVAVRGVRGAGAAL